MIKLGKKSTYIDLLTMIRKKTSYLPKDIHLFKVRYNKKHVEYSFERIEKENYSSDMFIK